MKKVKMCILMGILLLCVAVCLAGCTTVGPYVTNIAFDNEGNLLVTKSRIVLVPGLYQEIHSESSFTDVVKMPQRKEVVK